MKKFISVRSIFLSAALAVGSFTFSSCDDDKDTPNAGYAQNAVLITNEGGFNNSNASVSYYNRNTGTLENNIFSKANPNLLLGDVLQSMAIHNDQAFLVMNNSQKVVVVNANTFKAEGEINGLTMPRYFTALNDNKAYVTEWVSFSDNGRVAVIDLNTLTVTKTIPVGMTPEKLLIAGGKLYITNQGGNTITVINTVTDEVEATIDVTFGPNSLAVDTNNNLWVLSSGNKSWQLPAEAHTPGALTKINMGSNTIIQEFTFDSNTASASKLSINGSKNKLYYVYNNKVYQQDINASSLNTTPLINRGTYLDYGFYGFGVDPQSGYIYTGKTPDFSSDGWVVRFNQSGALVDSFKVGIAPNGFIFR